MNSVIAEQQESISEDELTSQDGPSELYDQSPYQLRTEEDDQLQMLRLVSVKSAALPQSSKCLNYQSLLQKRMTIASKQGLKDEGVGTEAAAVVSPLGHAPITPVKFRLARRRFVLDEVVAVPRMLQDHIDSTYGGVDSMLVDEVVDTVNNIYKPHEVARLQHTSTRRSISLYQL